MTLVRASSRTVQCMAELLSKTSAIHRRGQISVGSGCHFCQAMLFIVWRSDEQEGHLSESRVLAKTSPYLSGDRVFGMPDLGKHAINGKAIQYSHGVTQA
jgi:hypothetical protein